MDKGMLEIEQDFLTDAVTVRVRCIDCGETTTISDIPEKEWTDWRKGGLIQNVMPSVAKDSRELLITQTCSKCFDKLFEGLD